MCLSQASALVDMHSTSGFSPEASDHKFLGMSHSMQSMHWLFRRLCRQSSEPPQSMHRLFKRLCAHMLEPPQSVHRLFRRLCAHMLEPPQSVHRLFKRLCAHMPEPPQSMHWLFNRFTVFSQMCFINNVRGRYTKQPNSVLAGFNAYL